MSPMHSSARRPEPLRDIDYDHEIRLVDHTNPRPQSAQEYAPSSPVSDSSSRRHSDVPLRKPHGGHHLREEIARRKYRKYQDQTAQNGGDAADSEETPFDENDDQGEGQGAGQTEQRGRARESGTASKKEPESAIDVLYENQRGGFLCGMALFSSKALGNLDPAPWTNIAFKTSATDITNAQVPDPSWEWAWKQWTVNHEQGGQDEDGWEYSFAFSSKFSWHGPNWYNSYVRRRAWIRKRVKKRSGYQVIEAHMLNSDYFTIHPAQDRSSSMSSSKNDSVRNRYKAATTARREMEGEALEFDDIEDIGALMKILRFARIDREKTEAMENFIKNGGDDLYYLRDHMHEIMQMFIFQASRRSLLTHLLKMFNEESVPDEIDDTAVKRPMSPRQRRLDNLEAAVKAADEEVKKLEFWSDVKDMAERGHTVGAVDKSQGWDESWTGLDDSAPKDVLSNKTLPGIADCEKGEGNGTALRIGSAEKGKEIAKD